MPAPASRTSRFLRTYCRPKAEGTVSSLATLKPHSEFAAAEGDIARIVERIDRAGSVVIMCGAGCRGAADSLRALSDRLRAPLVHTLRGKELMAYDDPRWMGGLGMIGTKAVYHAVQNCDLLMMIGTDYPYSNFLPTKGSVIQIDERPAGAGATGADGARGHRIGGTDPEAVARARFGQDRH